MKKIITVLIIIAALISMAGCSSPDGKETDDSGAVIDVKDDLNKPEGCELDFWICENVADVDFSDYTEIFGVIGGKEYVSGKYEVEVKHENASDVQVLPDECVVYTLTAWPDYADFEKTGYHVTKIVITDPEISVHGVTTHSSRVEFRKAMTEAGFIIEDPVENGDSFIEEASTPGGTFSIRFESGEEGKITVVAPVSNRDGIEF